MLSQMCKALNYKYGNHRAKGKENSSRGRHSCQPVRRPHQTRPGQAWSEESVDYFCPLKVPWIEKQRKWNHLAAPTILHSQRLLIYNSKQADESRKNHSLTTSTLVILKQKEETHWGHWARSSSHQGKQSKREYLCRGAQIKTFPVAEGHWPQALKCPVATWPPRGLTKSKFLQPRSTPGRGEQVLLCDLQRCFIFHLFSRVAPQPARNSFLD